MDAARAAHNDAQRVAHHSSSTVPGPAIVRTPVAAEAQPDEALKASADDDHGATGIRPADRLARPEGHGLRLICHPPGSMDRSKLGPEGLHRGPPVLRFFVGIGIHILQHRTHEERTSVVFLFAITQPLMDYSMSAKELLSAINHAQQRHVAMVITALFALVGGHLFPPDGKGWLVVCACMMLAAAGAAVSAMKFGDHTILLYHYLWMFMTPYVSATSSLNCRWKCISPVTFVCLSVDSRSTFGAGYLWLVQNNHQTGCGTSCR